MARSRFRQPTILPGFGLTLGFTTFFLSVLVLMPLAACSGSKALGVSRKSTQRVETASKAWRTSASIASIFGSSM